MPNFIVTVCRTAHGFRDFHVKGAKNAQEASDIACANAGNHGFSEKNSEYSSEGVIQLAKGRKPMSNLPTFVK